MQPRLSGARTELGVTPSPSKPPSHGEGRGWAGLQLRGTGSGTALALPGSTWLQVQAGTTFPACSASAPEQQSCEFRQGRGSRRCYFQKKKKIKKKKPNPQPQASKHLLQAQLPRPAQEELLEMVSSGIQVKPSPLELPQHHPGEGSREEKLFQKPQILHPSAGITPSSSSATSWAPGTAPRPPGVTQVQLQREQGSCAAPGSQSPPKILPRSVLGSSRLTGSCRPGWPPGRPSPRRPPERSGWCPPGPPRGKSPQSPPSPSGSPATPSWRRPGRL